MNQRDPSDSSNLSLRTTWLSGLGILKGPRPWSISLLLLVSVLRISLLAQEPADIPAQSNQESEQTIKVTKDLLIRESTDFKILADLYRPDNDRKYPLVIMIHGGAWTTGDKWNLQMHAKEISAAGFVVVAVNYRLAPKYPYPAQLEDCQQAYDWALQNADQWLADSQHVGLWGYSAGGQLAAMIACMRSAKDSRLRACAAGGAPCEFSWLPSDSIALSHVMGGTPAKQPEAYRRASPVEFAEGQLCPFFLYHGSADLLVPPSSSLALHEKLLSLNVRSQHTSVQGKGHLMTFLDSDSRKRVIEFFHATLTDAN